MATVTDSTRTPAEERFLEAIDRAASESPAYPQGAVFVEAERLSTLAPMVSRYIREGRPVVVVFPDGEERVIRAEATPYFAQFTLSAVRRTLENLQRRLLSRD
jgi:hypothetical protein